MKKYSIITVGIAVLLAIVLLLFFGDRLLDQDGTTAETVSIATVDGVLVPVSEAKKVDGVDLSVGDTTVRTTEEGRFVFTDVDTRAGITLTHPELLRKVRFSGRDFLDAEGLLSVYFDVGLYNRLIRAIEWDARGAVTESYALLHPQIRARLSQQEFEAQRSPIFTDANLLDQEVIITNLEQVTVVSDLLEARLPNAYALTVQSGKRTATYTFVLVGNDAERMYFRVW